MKKKELQRLLRLAVEAIECRDEEIQKLHNVIIKKTTNLFVQKTKHKRQEYKKEGENVKGKCFIFDGGRMLLKV